MTKISSPGNVFFLGEHSIVYGRPAIVAAVNFRTHAEVKKRTDNKVLINSDGYGTFEDTLENLSAKEYIVKLATPTEPARNDYKTEGKMDVLAPAKDLIGRLAQIHGFKTGFDLSVKSEIPQNSGGMSSSTAFLSSVLGALNQELFLCLDRQNFFDVLLVFHVNIHRGAASGA